MARRGPSPPRRIGAQYQERGELRQALLVRDILDGLRGLPRSLTIEAPPLVEVTRHAARSGRFEWIGLINHTGQNWTAFLKPVPIAQIPLAWKAAGTLRAVRLLRAGADLPHTVAGGWVRCAVPRLDRFEVVLCTYEEPPGACPDPPSGVRSSGQ